jgi:succinate-acetate transporter protein
MSFVAILISLAAIYLAYAFVSTKLFARPVYPFNKISLD